MHVQQGQDQARIPTHAAGEPEAFAVNTLLDGVLNDYEVACQSATPPSLEDFFRRVTAAGVADTADRRQALLRELIALDLEYRWKRRSAQTGANDATLPSGAAAPDLPRLEDYGSLLEAHFGTKPSWPPSLVIEESRIQRQYGTSRVGWDESASPTISADQLLTWLDSSSILEKPQLDAFLASLPAPQPTDARQLADELIRQNLLTRFQLEAILGGQGNRLLLGNYVILEKIGQGGMGQVLKARHRVMERLVAIKMLPAHAVQDADSIARFRREVKAAARLSHPNIVAAFDADQSHGLHYLVMEYVAAHDLGTLIKSQGVLPYPAAIDYIVQAARGLHYAHTRGMIHRDVKPANMLLDAEGTIKILDLGLARFIETSDTTAHRELTHTGAVMGTMDFMAPEQANDTHQADARADIYSLGCTLYRLLTGENVYSGTTMVQKILAHRDQPIPSLLDKRPDVPAELDRIFRRMVAKTPGGRQQSMAEVISDLTSLLKAGSAPASSSASVNDPELSQFLHGLEGSASGRAAATRPAKSTLPAIPVSGDTVSTKAPDIVTDIGRRPLAAPSPAPLARLALRKPKFDPKLLIAAGLVGPLLLAGVIVVIKNQQGEVVARVPLPEGGSVSLETGTPDRKSENSNLKSEISDLKSTAPPPAIAPFDGKQARAHPEAWAKHLGTTVETTNSVGAKMILIPPGEFLMGSTDEQIEETSASPQTKDQFKRTETPQHRVLITKPLRMGATEVTLGQFRQFVEASKYVTEAEQYGFSNSDQTVLDDKVPAINRGNSWRLPGVKVPEDMPVTQVTWNDAVAYCQWLSQQEKTTYRLPTEAEWEYACRAGTTTQYSFGDDVSLLEQFAWPRETSLSRSKAVAAKPPNAFGLHDMHGNLAEWCHDFYDPNWYKKTPSTNPVGPAAGSSRVVRSGSFDLPADRFRSAYRVNGKPSFRHPTIGFRVVRMLDDGKVDLKSAISNPQSPSSLPAKAPVDAKTIWRATAEQQAFFEAVAKLPAEEQVAAVSKKMIEVNPAFDGALTPKIEGGKVVELAFSSHEVTDLWPVRALAGLRTLTCAGRFDKPGKLSDLSPLRGMPLTVLICSDTQVWDLSPLAGMRLRTFNCIGTRISDLSPLKGMLITGLLCSSTRVSDLAPLAGMPLTNLFCARTLVTDLSPLAGMPLSILSCFESPVSDLSVLAGMPLTTVQVSVPLFHEPDETVLRSLKKLTRLASDASPSTTNQTPEAFWQKQSARRQAAEAFAETTAKLPPTEQVTAISSKFRDVNNRVKIEFKPVIRDGVILEATLTLDARASDITPLRALSALKKLTIVGGPHWLDLSPLNTTPLEELSCRELIARRNAHVLRSMPTLKKIDAQPEAVAP